MKPECGASDGVHEGNLYTFVDLETGRSGSFVRCYWHFMEHYRKQLDALPMNHRERQQIMAARTLLMVAEGKLFPILGGPQWKSAELKSLGPMG